MELEEILARVESRLQALGLSAHAASLAAKKPDAIRNLKRAVKNGDRRGITTETLAALAPVLKTSASWLLEGTGDPNAGTEVKIVGPDRRRCRNPAGIRANSRGWPLRDQRAFRHAGGYDRLRGRRRQHVAAL